MHVEKETVNRKITKRNLIGDAPSRYYARYYNAHSASTYSVQEELSRNKRKKNHLTRYLMPSAR